MKLLVIGNGGREHALVWKLSQSKKVDKIFCAPGNAGIAKLADCINIPANDVPNLLEFAKKADVDLTIVGPELPLVEGIVDVFLGNHLKIVGPVKEAARLEGSKIFCKNVLRKYGIPTANFRTFNNSKSAASFLKSTVFPLVVKADGLAGGKGVIICHNESEAVVAIEALMEKKIFGKAGENIIIEEFLSGKEASIMALTDGKSILALESAQDYKRVFDNDKGPNTGGMGAFSPAGYASEVDYNRVIKEILVPIVHAMNKEGCRFKGVVYAGVMFTKVGPKVLEFNVRLGDPETQSLMLRLKADLLSIFLALVNEKLNEVEIQWDERPALCVVMASKGYPGEYVTNYEISGIKDAEKNNDVAVFHSGTARKNGKLVTAGGRVLGVTALGATLEDARLTAYDAVNKISFKDVHFRKDIGKVSALVSVR